MTTGTQFISARSARRQPATHPVVVGIDERPSPTFRKTLLIAAAEARRRHAGMLLVHGCEPLVTAASLNPGASMEQREAAGRETVAAAAELVKQQFPTGWPIELSVEPGSGAQLLEELSDVAALIVVERRSISAIQRWHTGSTTSRVAARARCPVLVTHENQDAGPLGAAVVVGVDDRGHAGIAVEVAFDEADLRRTDLLAVHAWHPADLATGFLPLDVDELAEARRCAQRDLAEALAGHCARYPDVPVRRRVVGGPVIQALAKACDGAGLLVLGRHGEQRVGTIALGSIARHCLSEVDCPVMITPVDRAERVPPRWIGAQVPVSPGY